MIACTMILASCSKEKQEYRNFYKKDGKWDISNISITTIKNGTMDNFQSVDNAGYFIFDKGGKGMYNITTPGNYDTGALTWNTENIIIDSEYYSILSSFSDNINLENNSSEAVGVDHYQYKTSISLKR